MKTKYTKEFLINFVLESQSCIDLLKLLNLKITGGNSSHIKKIIKHYNIDTSHWKNRGTKGKKWSTHPIEIYLNNEKNIASNILKKRLISEKFFEHKCYECNNTIWNNKPIPLELHHIDHNHDNNNLSNLMIICPNCHACKHEVKPYIKKIRTLNQNEKMRKVERPSYEQLLKEIENLGYRGTGKKYGVTDSSIKKWKKMYEKYN